MLSFFRSMRMDRYGALKDYKRELGGRIAQWFTKREQELWALIEEYIGIGELNEEAAFDVWKHAQEYDSKVQLVLDNALAALTREPLRAEMIKSSYEKVMKQVMILLLAGNNKQEACKYANYLYKYADYATKLKIVGTFGVSAINGAINDLPELVKHIPKKEEDELAESMVRFSDFEDITIVESTDSFPWIDFCGLDVDEDEETIELKIWISNKTSDILKFWIMNIHVNGEESGSLEILATVKPDESHYYNYQLELPDGVVYSEVENIDFYIEIDKPENKTILDTKKVYVRCDVNEGLIAATIKE